MNLEWYRTFIAIYKYGNATTASKHLFLTQPTVSQHISSLESAVGKPLFIRSAKGMTPTELGKDLYNKTAQYIENIEVVSESFTSDNFLKNKIVRLGSSMEFFYEKFIDVFNDLDYLIQVKFDSSIELINLLKNNQLDLVITDIKYDLKEIKYTKISNESYKLVCHPSLDCPELTHLTEENLSKLEDWLKEQNWLSSAVDLPYIKPFWCYLFKHRPEIKRLNIIPNLHIIKKAVENGLGITVLPEFLCQNSINQKRLKIVCPELPEIPADGLWISYNRFNHSNKIVTEISKKILKI